MEHLYAKFAKISLEDTKAAALQKRFDTKFLLNEAQLNSLLPALHENYSALSINNAVLQPYKTLYYDTPDLKLYQAHHNGVQQRYKLRTREYVQNGLVFNEVKHKTNTGKTIKTRILREQFETSFDAIFSDLASQSGFSKIALQEQLYVYYNRVTLVSDRLDERLTIDTNLTFVTADGTIEQSFPNLVILEQKRERGNRSVVDIELNRLRLRPSGFSKYCMGIAYTHPHIKQNLFQQKFRLINKLTKAA